jgi:hypothetical protein
MTLVLASGTRLMEELFISDETTARWLADFCPGKPLQSDEEDLKTRFRADFDSDGESGARKR